jgi:hypothetical protein
MHGSSSAVVVAPSVVAVIIALAACSSARGDTVFVTSQESSITRRTSVGGGTIAETTTVPGPLFQQDVGGGSDTLAFSLALSRDGSAGSFDEVRGYTEFTLGSDALLTVPFELLLTSMPASGAMTYDFTFRDLSLGGPALGEGGPLTLGPGLNGLALNTFLKDEMLLASHRYRLDFLFRHDAPVGGDAGASAAGGVRAVTSVPLPPAAWGGVALLAVYALAHARRRGAAPV